MAAEKSSEKKTFYLTKYWPNFQQKQQFMKSRLAARNTQTTGPSCRNRKHFLFEYCSFCFSNPTVKWELKLVKMLGFCCAQSEKDGLTHLAVNLLLWFSSPAMPVSIHAFLNPTNYALSIHSSINQHTHQFILYIFLSSLTFIIILHPFMPFKCSIVCTHLQFHLSIFFKGLILNFDFIIFVSI